MNTITALFPWPVEGAYEIFLWEYFACLSASNYYTYVPMFMKELPQGWRHSDIDNPRSPLVLIFCHSRACTWPDPPRPCKPLPTLLLEQEPVRTMQIDIIIIICSCRREVAVPWNGGLRSEAERKERLGKHRKAFLSTAISFPLLQVDLLLLAPRICSNSRRPNTDMIRSVLWQ